MDKEAREQIKKDGNEQIERINGIIKRLYTIDENGRAVPLPGVTKEQLEKALHAVNGISESYGKINDIIEEVNTEQEEHGREVAETRKLMTPFKDVLPDWMNKAWGVK